MSSKTESSKTVSSKTESRKEKYLKTKAAKEASEVRVTGLEWGFAQAIANAKGQGDPQDRAQVLELLQGAAREERDAEANATAANEANEKATAAAIATTMGKPIPQGRAQVSALLPDAVFLTTAAADPAWLGLRGNCTCAEHCAGHADVEPHDLVGAGCGLQAGGHRVLQCTTSCTFAIYG